MINNVVSFQLFRENDVKTNLYNKVGLSEQSNKKRLVYQHNSITQRLGKEVRHDQVDFTKHI